MRKNFINPEIEIDYFDGEAEILMLSNLTTAEQEVARILGVDVSSEKSGYVYSINRESVN